MRFFVRSPGVVTQAVVSTLGLVLAPMIAAASLSIGVAEEEVAAKIAGLEIVKYAKPEAAVDVTRTRIAERIMNERPLAMRFAGVELEADRYLVCELSAYGEIDFSVWSIEGRQVERLAEAEDIDGGQPEIQQACGRAVKRVAGIS